jgi:hypothetical protein
MNWGGLMAGSTTIAEPVLSEQEAAALRKMLKEIVEGPAFQSSQRSGQFLQFVVEKLIAGRTDELKERLIGVQLFRREPTYDTGDDAIVRVTASDVRRRLLKHYGWFSTDDTLRVELPLGTYVPRLIRKEPQPEPGRLAPRTIEPSVVVASTTPEAPSSPAAAAEAVAKQPGWAKLLLRAGVLLLCGVLGWSLHSLVPRTAALSAYASTPWSNLFGASGNTHLITSDPGIDALQGVTRQPISLSDYANHRYMPDASTLTPQQLAVSHVLLAIGASAGTPDPPIAARLAQIAQTFSKRLDVQAAREFDLSRLKSNDNFIFLGSPRSNPWSALFSTKLNFRFVFNNEMGTEFVENTHPRPGEAALYTPSAKGGDTGHSYATIAFLTNPDGNGHLLLIAGADGESTTAASEFASDMPRMASALKRCSAGSEGGADSFQILLRTETMAGVARGVDVVSCHPLS